MVQVAPDKKVCVADYQEGSKNNRESGFVVKRYPNGNLRSISQYEAGRKNGVEHTYGRRGNAKRKGYFNSGKEDGLFVCYGRKPNIAMVTKTYSMGKLVKTEAYISPNLQ